MPGRGGSASGHRGGASAAARGRSRATGSPGPARRTDRRRTAAPHGSSRPSGAAGRRSSHGWSRDHRHPRSRRRRATPPAWGASGSPFRARRRVPRGSGSRACDSSRRTRRRGADPLTPRCPSNSHSTGTTTGAPLSLIKTTTNFAGLVLLAFRPTT